MQGIERSVVKARRAGLQDAAAIARVHVDTWRSTYRGIVPDKYLDDMSYEHSQKNWEKIMDPNNRTAVFVAEDDASRVVGFAACGAVRGTEQAYKGELYAIYVDQNMQRKGLGKRLVLSAVQDLMAHGLDTMLAWVLAENPSKRFYESIGGTYVRTREATVGGKTLLERGYGWRDLGSLVARLAPE